MYTPRPALRDARTEGFFFLKTRHRECVIRGTMLDTLSCDSTYIHGIRPLHYLFKNVHFVPFSRMPPVPPSSASSLIHHPRTEPPSPSRSNGTDDRSCYRLRAATAALLARIFEEARGKFINRVNQPVKRERLTRCREFMQQVYIRDRQFISSRFEIKRSTS